MVNDEVTASLRGMGTEKLLAILGVVYTDRIRDDLDYPTCLIRVSRLSRVSHIFCLGIKVRAPLVGILGKLPTLSDWIIKKGFVEDAFFDYLKLCFTYIGLALCTDVVYEGVYKVTLV